MPTGQDSLPRYQSLLGNREVSASLAVGGLKRENRQFYVIAPSKGLLSLRNKSVLLLLF